MIPNVSRTDLKKLLDGRESVETVERVSFDYMVFHYSEFNFYMVLN